MSWSKVPENIELYDPKCQRKPEEIEEYINMAEAESTETEKITPSQYVWNEEGTLNRSNGHFLCTSCYIKVGQPSSSIGWICP